MSTHFKPVEQLEVWRILESGEFCRVGTLVQNAQGIYFQYAQDYLQIGHNLSPFGLAFDASLQKAPLEPHQKLHGVFADSLPDGWGTLLMDRSFRQMGVLPQQLTALDRLAFVGSRGMGSLFYRPESLINPTNLSVMLTIDELGLEAQAVFDGQATDVLSALVAVGSSGGARPKAQVYLNESNQHCATYPIENYRPYLVKFTSAHLALGHEEGLCETVYLKMADLAGIDVAAFHLLTAPQSSGATHWLAVERFDVASDNGRYHLHSACGLLDADFRMPSLDYETLIKVANTLCKSPQAGQDIFKRAMFNLLALNQDDHSKNWAFLQNDIGVWVLSPFYDVTFSPTPFGEHSTSFAGYGKQPPLKAMQTLAKAANFKDWPTAQESIQRVLNALDHWSALATEVGVSPATRQLIQQQLDQVRLDNQVLLI